jgi:protein-S-isoprenylcysteine O-methyltransferase Ste14
MLLRYPVNVHKGLTGPLVFGLMMVYDNWSTAAWVYLALHGSYGLLWLFKERVFPDKQWARHVSVGYGLTAFAGLALYWVAPFLLISQHREPAGWVIGLAVALNVWGAVLHFGSDAQKYFTLKYTPGLITEGFFARSRNTNYLGELMIYSGFAILAVHWAAWIGVTAFFAIVFVPNMLRKDKSLSRYPGFADYKRRTGLMLPRVFGRE